MASIPRVRNPTVNFGVRELLTTLVMDLHFRKGRISVDSSNDRVGRQQTGQSGDSILELCVESGRSFHRIPYQLLFPISRGVIWWSLPLGDNLLNPRPQMPFSNRSRAQ
jgi:hypothetical protein